MIDALLLLGYAVVAGTGGALWLRVARWPLVAPRLAIAAWQALAFSVLLALGASGLALAVSLPHVSGDLAQLLHMCVEGLRHGYASPGGALTAALGVTLSLALALRSVWCFFHIALGDYRERRTRIAMLDLLGRTDVLPDVLVIDHPSPYAFCVGGRRRRVVVTGGLLNALEPLEVEAVLAHERAHLQQRHHIALLLCRTLFQTLAPIFPAFRSAMPQIRLIAELCADDAARKRVGATALRTALATLACSPAPAGALAATALAVETRLRRLSTGHRPLGILAYAGTGLGIGAAVVIPLALACAPLIALAWKSICLIG